MVQLSIGRTRSNAAETDQSRSLFRSGSRSTAEPNRSSNSRLRSLVRTIVVGAAVAAVAYVASRWLRSDDGASVETDDVREMAEEIAPGEGHPIPIGEPGADESEIDDTEAVVEGENADADEGESEEGGADESMDAESGDELAASGDSSIGDDRSPEELEQLGEEDVGTEPAEPGAMTVDEDVLDEADVDDLADDANGDEQD